jgi:hypothetical protein
MTFARSTPFGINVGDKLLPSEPVCISEEGGFKGRPVVLGETREVK